MAVEKKFIEATKGKIVIGFLLACLALLMAWGTSKFVFGEMLNTVEKLSAPNDRLRIVNELSHQTARLDQFQKDQVIRGVANQNNFILETRRLRRKLDTLSILFGNDKTQLQRIKSVKNLLLDRDRQFLAYLKVRETLVNTKSFSGEVQKLNKLVSQRARETDSAVLTTETSTATTTVSADDDNKTKGFLNRLFGKKKADVYKIINEEFKVKRDTLNAAVEDSIMQGIKSSLLNIAQKQRYKSNRFLKKEADLADASNAITRQMLSLLREVEAETVAQIDANNAQAKAVVSDGISQITVIIIVFFVITLILVYLILTDIASSNRYRIALEEAKKEAEYHGLAKQRFLSNMSHEIRTPLQSILGYSELLLNQQSPRKKDLYAIYNSSNHLLQIVNEVLDYNRIISGKFTFNLQRFDMHQLLEEVFTAMQLLADNKNIKLIANFDLGEAMWVNGDPFRLKQILFNVLGNAVKFTIEGEILFDVTCKRNEQELHFNYVVKDTGIGFAEANLDKIFNEFEQVDETDQHLINKEGTGLGLAIVKELVQNLAGRIYVNSEVGIGTTFSIFLKFQIDENPVSESKMPISLSTTEDVSVWVIDDDELILSLCGLIFEQHNITHKSFNSTDKILEEPINNNVKFVLIDMRLPEMSGVELLALLKQKLPDNIIFYAITAQVLPDEMERVLNTGFAGIIMKPFKAADLLSIFDGPRMLVNEAVCYDLATLKRMTMGDEVMLKKILISFEQDCENDIRDLKELVSAQKMQEVRLIIHRLAGRVAQIGATALGAEFRLMEQQVAPLAQFKDNEKGKIDALLAKLRVLMTSLNAEV